MESSSSGVMEGGERRRKQQMVVMRHGQRWDDANREWRNQDPHARTWDPPLTQLGMEQAVQAGVKLRHQGVCIHRILVSPFLRCVQTATAFIHGMFPPDHHHDSTTIAAHPPVKVSLEYGLVELMNNRTIWYPPPNPHDPHIWNLTREELLSALPTGVVDASVPPLFSQLPNWEESYEDGHRRYRNTFLAAADMFPHDNILCISHGEGLRVSINSLNPKVSVRHVRSISYCGYTQAEREFHSPGTTGSWKLLAASGFLYKDITPKQ